MSKTNRSLSRNQVQTCSETYGDSFYLFDEARLENNFSRLRTAFAGRYPDTRIAYSFKTNYTPAICKAVAEMGGYAEVVSEMEYELARSIEIPGHRIIYNGPCKSFASVRDALHAGAIVNLDSMRDYANVMSVSSEAPQQQFSVGLRCNFVLTDGCGSRFGFDIDGAEFQQVIDGIRSSRNVTLGGLHCHFPNRDLASFRARTVQMLKIVNRIFSCPPDFLNLGGGYFGELPESMQQNYKIKAPAFAEYAETICDLLCASFGTSEKKPALYLEPGTALVADTLKFYTRVIDIKHVRGRHIATVAGSLFNVSPHSRLRCLPVRAISSIEDNAATAGADKYDIAGYTCIEDDYLTRDFSGPLKVGDFLEYSNVGSYSIVMKPPFILPNVPILAISANTDKVSVIRRGESAKSLFESFS